MASVTTSASELLDAAARAYLRDGSLGLTALQQEERRSALGGSDAGAIVAGGREWRTLWAQKTGRSDGDDLSGVLAVMMGHWTEAFNRCWYELQTGRKVERVSEHVRHSSLPYLAVNLDGMSTTTTGHPCSWQAKHVGASGDRVTLRYTAQCTHEALCLGVDWWVMSTFIGNSRWELTEQEIDPLFAGEYLDRCREFWRYVETDREPPDDVPPLGVPAPKAPLITVHLDDDSRAAWPNWGVECVEEIGAYVRTLPAHQAHEIAKKHIKELIPDHVGTIIRGDLKIAKDRAGAIRFSIPKAGAKTAAG